MQKANEKRNNEFRLRLQDEFARRLRTNERYSIRAFAQFLGMDSSCVSQIFSGKRLLSDSKLKSLSGRVGFASPTESARVLEFTKLQLDMFSAISDWYHFAILDLTFLKTFKSDPPWIARKLGIEVHQALGAIERLKRLGMLISKNGKLHKAQGFYTNYEDGETSAALKEYQRQIIRKALLAVDSCPAEAKDITSMTIAADSKKLREAKAKIKAFRRKLCLFLENGEKDTVFHLAVQLYPVTNNE